MINDVPLFFSGWTGLVLHLAGTDLPVAIFGAVIVYGTVGIAFSIRAIYQAGAPRWLKF